MANWSRTVTQRTIRMTVETEALMIVRRAKAVQAWCPDCHAEVAVIAVNGGSDAAARIREWLAAGKLHCWWPANGPAQICVPSLLQCFEAQQVQEFLRSLENSLDQSRRQQK